MMEKRVEGFNTVDVDELKSEYQDEGMKRD